MKWVIKLMLSALLLAGSVAHFYFEAMHEAQIQENRKELGSIPLPRCDGKSGPTTYNQWC